jgi:ketosteroid isomerase-like protein
MSEENVEVVRRVYDCLNEGDVEGVIELCADGFVMDMSGRVFNPDVYEGPDGVRRFYQGVKDAWESYHWSVDEARVTGDSVVALLNCRGQSREGGPEVDWRVAWLWKFGGGSPVSVRFYRDRDEALQAAEQSE